jgi:predicted small secreted protein
VKSNKKCHCGSDKQVEVISKGIIQKVWYDGDYIVKEETTYEKTTKNSRYYCAECGNPL